MALRPVDTLTDQQRSAGLRWTTWQGVTATTMYSVINNGFLVAYALALGASNFQVGVLAALPFVGHPFQIAALLLVDRLRLRKLITVACWAPSQTIWLLIALIPFFVEAPGGAAVGALLALMGVRSVLVAFVNTGWNSWLRDLVPQSILGSYFSRRLAVSTIAAAAFGLAAAFFVDAWSTGAAENERVYGYSIVLAAGAIALGLTSVIAMALVPEPRMAPPSEQARLRDSLGAPFRDPGFRSLIWFLGAWSFASSLAIPFFALHMLVRLGFPLPLVIGLLAGSQFVSAAFLDLWGRLADRHGFKAVLWLSASLYLFVILGWTFTTLPDRLVVTVPMAVVLLAFAGIAAAGINLSVETIGLKLAPAGASTPHLVAASLATSVGAAVGPIIGGASLDFFNAREMSIVVAWRGPDAFVQLPALFLTGFDFLFALAFLLGLPTLMLLRGVYEQGEVNSDVVLDELFAEGQGLSRAGSLVPGLGLAASVPFSYLRRVPGINVGVGATLYQLRAAVQGAVAGLRQGKRFASTLTARLDRALGRVLTDEDVERRGTEFAREVARGVVDSSRYIGMAPETVAKHALRSAATVMTAAGAAAGDALHGAAQGAMLSAAEAGADVGLASATVIRAAREAGVSIGLSEESAMQEAVQGVAEAVEELTTLKRAGPL